MFKQIRSESMNVNPSYGSLQQWNFLGNESGNNTRKNIAGSASSKRLSASWIDPHILFRISNDRPISF